MPVANEIDQTDALGDLSRMAEAIMRGVDKLDTEPLHNLMIQAARDTPEKSGALRRSLTRKSDRAHVWLVDNDSVAIGTNLSYGYRAIPTLRMDVDALTEAFTDALMGPFEGEK